VPLIETAPIVTHATQERPLELTALVVGAGVAGTVAALSIAAAGGRAVVVDQGPDPRAVALDLQHPQPLALLGPRSRTRLAEIGVDLGALERLGAYLDAEARHGRSGTLRRSPFAHERILAVDPLRLRRALVEAAAASPAIRLRFDTRVVDADLATGVALLRPTGSGAPLEFSADLIIGADGAASTIRDLIGRAAGGAIARRPVGVSRRVLPLRLPEPPHPLSTGARLLAVADGMSISAAADGSGIARGELLVDTRRHASIDAAGLLRRFPEIAALSAIGPAEIVELPAEAPIEVRVARLSDGRRTVLVGDAACTVFSVDGVDLLRAIDDSGRLVASIAAVVDRAAAISAYEAVTAAEIAAAVRVSDRLIDARTGRGRLPMAARLRGAANLDAILAAGADLRAVARRLG
jgi:kynurenine 3-monooxygenase